MSRSWYKFPSPCVLFQEYFDLCWFAFWRVIVSAPLRDFTKLRMSLLHQIRTEHKATCRTVHSSITLQNVLKMENTAEGQSQQRHESNGSHNGLCRFVLRFALTAVSNLSTFIILFLYCSWLGKSNAFDVNGTAILILCTFTPKWVFQRSVHRHLLWLTTVLFSSPAQVRQVGQSINNSASTKRKT